MSGPPLFHWGAGTSWIVNILRTVNSRHGGNFVSRQIPFFQEWVGRPREPARTLLTDSAAIRSGRICPDKTPGMCCRCGGDGTADALK